MTRPPRGFAALVSVLILSALLLGTLAGASAEAAFARADAARLESHRAALTLAQSCIALAGLRLRADPGYVGSSFANEDGSCAIRDVRASDAVITFTATAEVQGIQARFTARFARGTLILLESTEEPAMPP